MGKQIIFYGLVLVFVGGVIALFDAVDWNYSNPLDFRFNWGNTRFFFPLGSSILISVLLSFLLYIFRKFTL